MLRSSNVRALVESRLAYINPIRDAFLIVTFTITHYSFGEFPVLPKFLFKRDSRVTCTTSRTRTEQSDTEQLECLLTQNIIVIQLTRISAPYLYNGVIGPNIVIRRLC